MTDGLYSFVISLIFVLFLARLVVLTFTDLVISLHDSWRKWQKARAPRPGDPDWLPADVPETRP